MLILLLVAMSRQKTIAHIDPVGVHPSETIKLIENKGQWNAEVLFKAAIPGGDVFITAKGLVYSFINEQQLHSLNHSKSLLNTSIDAHNYRVLFKGSKTSNVTIKKGEPFGEVYNYYLGSDKTKWASGCRGYQSIILQNIYPGIDAEIIGKEAFIKLNFLIQSGADASAIKLAYEGQNNLKLQNGNLIIETSIANIREEAPIAFQQQEQVNCSYNLKGNEVSFNLASYNKQQPIIIDPNIVFGTFSGSVADNFGFTATYDYLGNGFAGGTVFSSGFPATFGSYQINFAAGGSKDVGILKFSSDGSQLLYATYLGGNGDDQPHSIICNGAGDLYIFGTTNSSNFPTTTGAFDRSYNGNYDMYVSCLSADGSTLKNSTYWGGAQNDGINGKSPSRYSLSSPLAYNYGDTYRGSIVLDQNENVCIASVTESKMADGYTISNAFQPTFGGGNQDGCVFKLTSNLSTVLFSSYIGGDADDAAYSIVLDRFNNIFVCGGTQSSNLGKFEGALSYRGNVDAFVAKIGALGNSLQKLIYIGTSAYDQAYFIDIDSKLNIFITGQTEGNFPVKGVVYTNILAKQFITTLNNNLDSIRYSTVFGAPNNSFPGLSPSAFMVDECDRVYFSGWGGASNNSYNSNTGSTQNCAITSNAFQKTTDGSDFYLAVFTPDMKQLSYATYYGGSLSSEHVDGGTSRFDKKGIVYQSVCAGCGGYSDFPTTPDAYSKINNGKRPNNPTVGGCNNALFKFSLNVSDNAPIVRDTFISLTATDLLNYVFNVTDPDGDSVNIDFSGNVFSSINPPSLLINKGKSNALITLIWQTLCSHSNTDTMTINIKATDNACPTPNSSNATIKLLITPPPILDAPYPQCLQTINDSTVALKWTSPSTVKYFKQYEIYRKKGNDNYTVYSISTSATDTQFIDTLARQHLTENYCYFIKTINTCDSSSSPSRTICSLFQNDTNQSLFAYADTILYVIATDTLTYTFSAESIVPLDSVFISVGGNIFATNRVLSTQAISSLKKASYFFTWRSICDDMKRSTDTIKLQLLIRDNECPQSRTQKAEIRIIVLPPPTDFPPSMQCTRSTGVNSVLVKWNKPNPTRKYFSHYVLLRKNNNGLWKELAIVKHDSAFVFEDNEATDNVNQNICYSSCAVNVCGIAGDTAPLTCTVIKNIFPPPPIYIYTTSVKENKKISLQWQKSSAFDFLNYSVFKKDDDQNADYRLLTTINDINDTVLTDEKVNVHKHVYCYQLKQTNDCGITNTDSHHACSILLKGMSKPFEHSLQWNEYDYWKKGLNEYAIIKKEPTLEAVVANTTYYKTTQSTDNRLNVDNGLYYYTIEASENNSIFKSISNTIELIQSPLLHVPNAFTPNHDNINDTWKPVPAFVKDFHLKLFNRWGQLIFETTDKHHHFTDEFMNDPATCDVFVYLITYTGWDGSTHTVKDNVTLLK